MRKRALGPVLRGLIVGDPQVLDVGGNDGSLTTGSFGGGARRIVLDVDRRGLEKARDQGLAGVLASAVAIPLPGESVDVALCCDVLPCVPAEDTQRVYAEISRVMKSGGHLVITEVDERYKLPFVDNELAFARWRVQTGGFSHEQLEALLAAAGFVVVDHRMFYGVITRFGYTLIFFWTRSWRGHRVKQRIWKAIANLERWWCPLPQAHLIVAEARS